MQRVHHFRKRTVIQRAGDVAQEVLRPAHGIDARIDVAVGPHDVGRPVGHPAGDHVADAGAYLGREIIEREHGGLARGAFAAQFQRGGDDLLRTGQDFLGKEFLVGVHRRTGTNNEDDAPSRV